MDRERWLARLRAVQERLREHADRELPGLTDADPESGERWEAGQVWAHLAEFPAYWLSEIGGVLSEGTSGVGDAVPFVRTKADAGRLAAIERDRRTAPEQLMRRVAAGISDWAALTGSLPPEAAGAIGLHPTLGEMSLAEMLERFVVGHLEEHADQLDALAGAAPPS